MPRPTASQLTKINKFSQTPLKEEQVYVFRSLSADTLPVKRYSWFGEYSINFSDKMLQKLKRDYKGGVGLLASHNNNRLPFGRTFDAEVLADEVNGESVKTLYIDHYMVTHMEGENGEKRSMPTEIGMTTQEIADHIEVGHTFDTSIGFSMSSMKCSLCLNDLHDYEKCEHIPGLTYKNEDGEEVRCNIIAEDGEGMENSLVYAGAVNRAIIQNSKEGDEQSFSAGSTTLPDTVKFGDDTLYTVDDIKNLPKGSTIYGFLSKGNLQLYTSAIERRDFNEFMKSKGSGEMSGKQAETAVDLSNYVTKEAHEAALSAKDGELLEALAAKALLEEELAAERETVVGLQAKAALADKFTEDLVDEVVKAGVAARGNAFNAERYEKYARTLSVEELKEELGGFKEEFSGAVREAAQVTETELTAKEVDAPNEQLTLNDIRQEAAKIAAQKYARDRSINLADVTKQEFEALKAKHKL